MVEIDTAASVDATIPTPGGGYDSDGRVSPAAATNGHAAQAWAEERGPLPPLDGPSQMLHDGVRRQRRKLLLSGSMPAVSAAGGVYSHVMPPLHGRALP